jgi:acetyl-CoA carboxylase biotin carboxylase subunit/3-methylcrotonyl-CoA carboxylase alpha subunit
MQCVARRGEGHRQDKGLTRRPESRESFGTMALFSKVLIANRGEIARRVIRTCKRLGIKTVAVYSEADAEAPHVTEADEAVLLGPAPAKDSYLNIDAILGAIRQTGATAVHPGYGFLSEKSAFARAVAEAGVTFVGPNPDTLDAFGDKMKARHVALAAGTSPVPGTDEPIGIETPEEIAAVKALAGKIGYPIVVKAVGGGGGIGMQVVQEEAALERALKSCSDRGKASFADPRVYIERYVSKPRHIEVQILADKHGNSYALGERECSLQRRHQKIVEETPSPAAFFQGEAGQGRRQALFDAALRVVRQVGYVGAGTCEFIADADGNLFFLEVNARLQVEHPVTEMVTGLDLVELQLRVAAGEKLPDLSAIKPKGHAIETRVYAEDPWKGFIPKPGPIDELSWAGGVGDAQTSTLRVESGVRAGNKVTPFYDPMIAKIVAWGQTRDAALAELDRALEGSHVAPCVTNMTFVRKVLANEEFRAGQYDTKFAETFAKKGP